MIKGAIFDFDGTLFDSMSVWMTATSKYLATLGLQAQHGLDKTVAEMSMLEGAMYLKEVYSLSLAPEAIVDGINKQLMRFYAEEAAPKNGCLEVLKELKRRKIPACIATSTDRPMIEAALGHWGLQDYFTRLFTCSEVGYGKENPVIYSEAMAFLGSSQSETLVVEDALYAVRSAKKAGYRVVGIFDRHEPGRDEVKALADWYLPDLTGILEILKEA